MTKQQIPFSQVAFSEVHPYHYILSSAVLNFSKGIPLLSQNLVASVKIFSRIIFFGSFSEKEKKNVVI